MKVKIRCGDLSDIVKQSLYHACGVYGVGDMIVENLEVFLADPTAWLCDIFECTEEEYLRYYNESDCGSFRCEATTKKGHQCLFFSDTESSPRGFQSWLKFVRSGWEPRCKKHIKCQQKKG